MPSGPTFASFPHKENHCLHNSYLCRYRHIMAPEYFFQGLQCYPTKFKFSKYFLTALLFIVDPKRQTLPITLVSSLPILCCTCYNYFGLLYIYNIVSFFHSAPSLSLLEHLHFQLSISTAQIIDVSTSNFKTHLLSIHTLSIYTEHKDLTRRDTMQLDFL